MAALWRPQAPPSGTTWLPTVIVLTVLAATLLAAVLLMERFSPLNRDCGLCDNAGSSVSFEPRP